MLIYHCGGINVVTGDVFGLGLKSNGQCFGIFQSAPILFSFLFPMRNHNNEFIAKVYIVLRKMADFKRRE